MVSEPAPGASLHSGPCYVQGADSVSPFAGSETPATAGQTMAPFGNGPQVGHSAAPFGASVPPVPAASPAASSADDKDDADAWYNKAPTYSAKRGKDRSVFLRLFILMVKLMPAAMVLGGGYYGYKQFFGKMSDEEMAALHAANPNLINTTGGESMSRAELVLKQAKDSIAAHDQNVHAANALAESPDNLDQIAATLDDLDAAMLASKAGAPAPIPEPKVKLAFDDAPSGKGLITEATGSGRVTTHTPSQAEQALTNFAGPMSTASRDGSGATAAASVTIHDAERSTAEPTTAFREWVGRVTVSGVRVGSDPRAFIAGRLVRPGMKVDHRLGIHLSQIDEQGRLLYFEDDSGAVLAKRY